MNGFDFFNELFDFSGQEKALKKIENFFNEQNKDDFVDTDEKPVKKVNKL